MVLSKISHPIKLAKVATCEYKKCMSPECILSPLGSFPEIIKTAIVSPNTRATPNKKAPSTLGQILLNNKFQQ